MSNPSIGELGSKFWLDENNQYHREDGPAIEWRDGGKEWWLHGICYSQEEFERLLRLKAFW